MGTMTGSITKLRSFGLTLATLAVGISFIALPVAHAGLLDNADDDIGAGPVNSKETPIQPAGKPTTVTEVVEGQQQMPMLQSNSAQLLQDAQARYSAIAAQGGWPQVPRKYFKKGDTGQEVAILNRRLYLEGYLRVEGTQGQYASIFTTATQDSVVRFQRNHGLFVTGRIDDATLAELNVPVEKRLQAIAANIPRLATYEQGLGDRYLVVNIPSQQLEAVQNGRVSERHNVIVGRPARPTPIVMTKVDTVKFNPYWNAPLSIVRKDILPKLQSSTKYLTDINMKILEGGPNGPEVDPKTLNFKTIIAQNYLFRQEPGPENAMATAKIEFHSPFGIYLHDTSEKDLFNYNNRFFSSGCIRIEKMPQLVNWVLNGQDGFDPTKIADMAKTLERLDVPMPTGPQLRVAYLTAYPAAQGTIAFRNDIYQMDGSGFTVGQPMPVGQMSPDGQRFVLKPLPNTPPVDAAEAEGRGFFGKQNMASRPMNSLFSSTRAGSADIQSSSNFQPATTYQSGSKPKGLFDWDAYYKRQAAEELKANGGGALKLKKKSKANSAVASTADDKKVGDKKASTTINKAVAVKKPAIKKKLDCTPGSDGQPANGCAPIAATADAAPATTTTTAAVDTTKKQ